MSQQQTRRPARKRQPEERPPAASQPVEAVPALPDDLPERETTHDPGGWLAIVLLAMAVAAVGFYTVLTLLAAN